jgi:prepilin-type N-terminal cleavage/methylation domain-containing protein
LERKIRHYLKLLRYFLLKKDGFSLIEIAMGLIILAIGLLGIASMQITSVRGGFFSGHLTEATFLGQDGLETLKSLHLPGGNSPAPLSEGQHNFGHTPDDASGAIPGTNFTRVYTVTRHPTLQAVRIIRIAVNWTDQASHTVSYTTTRTNLQ